MALLAGAVEYANCISAEGKDYPKLCPGYDTKYFVGDIPVMVELCGMWSTCLLSSLQGPP